MNIQDDIEDYWTRRGEGFSDAVNDEFINGTNPLREELVGDLGITCGTRVLDVGCGPGYFEMLLKDTGAELHAIDYSTGMVENARANMDRYNIDADIRRMDAQNLEFEDGTFDVVISRNVIWSLPDPEKAYSEIIRVMKPGAKAFIVDGNYYLHLYDERYRMNTPTSEMKHEEGPGSHGKFNKGAVDFNEINELARSLPLSKEVRPAWDYRILSEMACSKINTTLRARNDGGVRRIGMFSISFTKEAC